MTAASLCKWRIRNRCHLEVSPGVERAKSTARGNLVCGHRRATFSHGFSTLKSARGPMRPVGKTGQGRAQSTVGVTPYDGVDSLAEAGVRKPLDVRERLAPDYREGRPAVRADRQEERRLLAAARPARPQVVVHPAELLQEAKNRPNIPLQEKFHGGVLEGVRNICGTL